MSDSLRDLCTHFDLIRYLEAHNVEYIQSGDNVGQNWIGIMTCPFCGDKKAHCGVHRESKYISCWQCGVKVNLFAFIQQLEQCSFGKSVDLVRKYQVESLAKAPGGGLIWAQRGKVLPDHAFAIDRGSEPQLVRKWFLKRNFPLSWCQEYNLHYVAHGKYQLRLIIPVYYRGVIVSFVAAALTGKAKIKYLDCPKEKARIYNKELCYGLDDIGNEILIIVEGVTDKWALGNDSVALFTKEFTKKQVTLLRKIIRERSIKRVIVALDADAQDKANELCGILQQTCSDCWILEYDSFELKDPADYYSSNKIVHLKNIIYSSS